jgi:hypothetical protein
MRKIKDLSTRRYFELVRTQLANERSSFESHWRDIGDHIWPRGYRFSTSDTNQGDKRQQKIIDSTGSLALRTLSSGMMSGVTSPARPWFRLTVSDPQQAESSDVKTWLDEVGRRMTTVFLRSNLYNALPILYKAIGAFGTSALYMEEDFDEVVRFSVFPVGSFSIANDSKLKVRVFHREFRMTVRQLVQEFGITNPDKPQDINWSKLSETIKNQWMNGMYEDWIDVYHYIIPNDQYEPDSDDPLKKKFLSIYLEAGKNNDSGLNLDEERVLRKQGHSFFPILCPRWELNGQDVYGTSCPGMDTLPDIKQLQLHEKRSLQAIEKMVNPPMTAPTGMRNQKVSLLPGDVTFTDIREGQQGLRPIHEVRFSVRELEEKSQQIRNRIQRGFYEDLFLMLAASDRRQITAREIEERHEEKLLALGPVLEQLNQDLLDPLIDNTFAIMLDQGLIPPAPEELQGQDLKIEYISIMAQAQKLIGIGAVERFTSYAGQVAQYDPSVLQKISADQLIDVYSELVSLPAGVVRSDDEVAEIRAEMAARQQAMQQAEQAQMQAATAKDLSQSKIEDDNGLGLLIDRAQSGQIGNPIAGI